MAAAAKDLLTAGKVLIGEDIPGATAEDPLGAGNALIVEDSPGRAASAEDAEDPLGAGNALIGEAIPGAAAKDPPSADDLAANLPPGETAASKSVLVLRELAIPGGTYGSLPIALSIWYIATNAPRTASCCGVRIDNILPILCVDFMIL